MFANLKIGQRLTLGFALVLALSIVIAAIGIWRLQTVSEATSVMMRQPLKKERWISDWYTVLISGVKRTTAIAKSSDASLSAYFAEDAKASSVASTALQNKIEPLITSEEEKTQFAKLGEARKIYLALRSDIDKAKQAGDAEGAMNILDKTFVPAASNYSEQMRVLLEMQRNEIDAAARQIDTIAKDSRILLIALEVLALALGMVVARYLTVGITRPIRTAAALSRRVADGDLTGDIVVKSRDETGQLLQSLQDMNIGLRSIVSDVRVGTDTIATASAEIAAGNLDLSSRTEQQAASLEETASAMEQLISTVKQNADNARQANQLASTASAIAVQGGSVVGEVVDTMGSINASSRKIVDIIGVIDSIAFQTNILALNAAVEAARAGEQGRGFAVVASEVRNLAQRSAAAAKEIKVLIDDSVNQVDSGSKLVARAGATMAEVVESVKRVTDVVAEISMASQEQTTGIEQINHAITQMDQVTQQNAALVEQAAAAAASMQTQASHLAGLVDVFKLDNSAQNKLAKPTIPGMAAQDQRSIDITPRRKSLTFP